MRSRLKAGITEVLVRAIAYDTETTGLSRHRHSIFSFSTCDEDGRTSVHRLDGSAVRIAKSRVRLEQLWRNPLVPKVMHNAKFDLGHTEFFLKRDLSDHIIHDTYMMSHILQNHHPSHALKDLSWELAGIPKDDETAIKAYTRGGNSYQTVPEHLMERYQHRDAERCMLLHLFFWPKISRDKNLLECYQYEVDLIKTTIRMENRGVMINPKKCEELITRLTQDKERVFQRFKQVTGETFSPSQDDRVRWYLFHKLKLPTMGKTKTGRDSVDKEVLLELRKAHPCEEIDLLLQYRSWTKGAKMISNYLELADSDGVLHPNIQTCRAITGRQSCSDPNLQNVEKHDTLLNPFPVPARQVFRPRPGYVNFHLDYSGIEMRLLIHYSGDKILVDLANDPQGDVHLPATRIFYGRRYDDGTKEEKKALRGAAKNANFAVAYGAQPAKVAVTLGLSPGEGVTRFSEYRRTFPKLCDLMRTITRTALQEGKVVTAFGRPIHLPREYAYIGTNYLIQATAAEILKRGEVRADRYLRETTGDEMRILLPIHDEVIIECPRRRLKDAKPILKEVCRLMVDFPGRFRVPLEVGADIATVDWARKEEFSFED